MDISTSRELGLILNIIYVIIESNIGNNDFSLIILDSGIIKFILSNFVENLDTLELCPLKKLLIILQKALVISFEEFFRINRCFDSKIFKARKHDILMHKQELASFGINTPLAIQEKTKILNESYNTPHPGVAHINLDIDTWGKYLKEIKDIAVCFYNLFF